MGGFSGDCLVRTCNPTPVEQAFMFRLHQAVLYQKFGSTESDNPYGMHFGRVNAINCLAIYKGEGQGCEISNDRRGFGIGTVATF